MNECPITFSNENKQGSSLFNTDFFTSNTQSVPLTDMLGSNSSGKKRGRPAKKKLDDGSEIVLADDAQPLPQYKSNEPYLHTYDETTNMLKSSVMQIDMFQNDIKTELDQIKNSKTLKKKYDYISMLTSTASTLIGTKVTAIREMNNTITNSHNLELKRIKDLKMTENQVDDDKRIMDMYNAFISTPVGNYGGGAPNMGPSITDMTMMNPNSNIVRTDISASSYHDSYMQNLTPTQNMMLLEQNPDIKTVVVYDASTGNRWFDVMNVRTGESVSNVNKPDNMFLEDTTLDTRNGIARNVNLDTTYPLITINNSRLTEY